MTLQGIGELRPADADLTDDSPASRAVCLQSLLRPHLHLALFNDSRTIEADAQIALLIDPLIELAVAEDGGQQEKQGNRRPHKCDKNFHTSSSLVLRNCSSACACPEPWQLFWRDTDGQRRTAVTGSMLRLNSSTAGTRTAHAPWPTPQRIAEDQPSCLTSAAGHAARAC
jgi:hypothetical protein